MHISKISEPDQKLHVEPVHKIRLGMKMQLGLQKLYIVVQLISFLQKIINIHFLSFERQRVNW